MKINKCDVCGKEVDARRVGTRHNTFGVFHGSLNPELSKDTDEPTDHIEIAATIRVHPSEMIDVCADCLKKGNVRVQYVLHDTRPKSQHESRSQGMTVDWKRMKELRRKSEAEDKDKKAREELSTDALDEFTHKAHVHTTTDPMDEKKVRTDYPIETLGQRVERLREAKGWHQIDLARETVFRACRDQPGLSLDFIDEIESGNMIVLRTEETVLLAAALDVPRDYLMTGKDD